MTDTAQLDSLLDEQRRMRAGVEPMLRATVSDAAAVAPDAYATQRRVAGFLGYPVDSIASDLKSAEQQATIGKVADDTAPYPALQRRYTDADFARLAHDDSGALAAVAKAAGEVARYVTSADDRVGLLRDIGAFRYKVPQWVGAAQSVLFETLAAPQEALGGTSDNIWHRAGAAGLAVAKDYGARAQAAGSQWDPNSVLGQVFGAGTSSGVQSALQNVVLGGGALALAGPAGIPAALLAMSATQGLESYQKAKEKGASQFRALLYGVEDAVAEYTFEKFWGVGGFLERVAAGSSAGRLLMYEVTHETTSEMATTLWQNFNEWANLNPDKSLKAWLAEQPAALAQTVVATLVGGGGQVAVTAATRRMVENAGSNRLRVLAAEQAAANLSGLLESAKTVKLLNRSPEVFRETLDELAARDDGTPQVVRFDAETLADALAQSGIERADFEAKLPSIAAQMPEAIATGGEISLPVGEYVAGVIGTPLEQALQQHARVGDNEFSQVEAAEIVKEAEQTLAQSSERVLAQAQEQDATRASGEAVRQRVLDRLNEANRFSPDANGAYATLWQHFFTTMAVRAKTTPEALFNRFDPRVDAVGSEGEALTLKQDMIDLRKREAVLDNLIECLGA